jgi:hypothetical protein
MNELNAESRLITPLPISGGWANVRADFLRNELKQMRNYPRRNVVMIVDFDLNAYCSDHRNCRLVSRRTSLL